MSARRTWKVFVVAIVSIAFGCTQLFFAWRYSDAARREASTVGTITHVHHGKGTTYSYEFEVNGVTVRDSSDTCVTSIAPPACEEGGQVLVYYDPNDLSLSSLQELLAASRKNLFWAGGATGIGLLMLWFYFWNKGDGADSEDSKEPDAGGPNEKPEVLHIAPDK